MIQKVIAVALAIPMSLSIAAPSSSEAYLDVPTRSIACESVSQEMDCIIRIGLFDPEIPVPFDPDDGFEFEPETPATGGFNPVPTKISITTNDLRIGVERRTYLSTINIVSPCISHVYEYEGLPDGLTGKKNVIAGIPKETGRFTVNVSVTGNTNCVVPEETRSYSLRIRELLVRKIYFTFDSTTLTTDAKAKLARLADRLDNGNTGVKIRIIGYVFPMADLVYAKKIAESRARAVERHLRSLGLEGNYVVTSKANSLPPVSTSRRVEVIVTYLGVQ